MDSSNQWQNVTKDTLYTKLPEAIAKKFANFEKWKKMQRQKAEEIEKHSSSDELKKVSEQVATLKRRVSSVMYNMEKTKETVEMLKQEVKQELDNTELAQSNFLKLQSSHFYPDKNYTSKYFEQVADKLSKRMKEIWNQIEEVSIILASSKEQKQHTSGQCLQDTLKTQQEIFLNVAANLANLHEIVNDLREKYIRDYVQTEGVDPFKEPDQTSLQIRQKMTFKGSLPGLVPNQQQQQQQQQQTGFGFGTTGQSSSGFSFGSTDSGFSFGGNTGSGFSFGSTDSSSGFTFGGNTGGGFSFGGNTSSGTSGGFSFGGDTGSGFSFGGGGTSSGFSFGGDTSSGFGFGGSSNFSATGPSKKSRRRRS